MTGRRYEHKVVLVTINQDNEWWDFTEVEADIDKLAKVGWEVAAVLGKIDKRNNSVKVIFKRPASD